MDGAVPLNLHNADMNAGQLDQHARVCAQVQQLSLEAEHPGELFHSDTVRPFTGLRHLELTGFSGADLASLPPSVRSVTMVLPSVHWVCAQLLREQAALPPHLRPEQGELQAAMEAPPAGLVLRVPADESTPAATLLARQWLAAVAGTLHPLARGPQHRMDSLTIRAGELSIAVDVAMLARCAAHINVRAQRVQLAVPQQAAGQADGAADGPSGAADRQLVSALLAELAAGGLEQGTFAAVWYELLQPRRPAAVMNGARLVKHVQLYSVHGLTTKMESKECGPDDLLVWRLRPRKPVQQVLGAAAQVVCIDTWTAWFAKFVATFA